jgi:hypothetical protein
MATYVNDLRLKEITTGDESGTWGTSTNTNLELIAEAFSYGTEVITTNADTHTTTIADGATDPGRSLYLKYTGTLDSACTITIGPNTVSKVWIIENGTSGSQNIIISQGSGANITIPAGDTKVVYSDGAGAGAAFVDAFASLNVVDLKVQDDLTVTDDASIGGDATITGTLGVTGVVTANAGVVVDNFTLDGTTLALSSGDFTVDVAGDLILDFAGDDLKFVSNGSQYGLLSKSSNSLLIRSTIADGDIILQGNDSGDIITALTLDMSDAGTATFNHDIKTAGDGNVLTFSSPAGGGGGTNTINFKHDLNTLAAAQIVATYTSDYRATLDFKINKVQSDSTPTSALLINQGGNATFSGTVNSGASNAVGIGGTPADVNATEVGPGYLNLSRDDTAHATQIQFGKNGVVAGKIHTDDRLSIGTSSTGIYFYNSGNSILPYNNSAATPTTRDAAIDLGSSGARFKDLYLSGSVIGSDISGASGTTSIGGSDANYIVMQTNVASANPRLEPSIDNTIDFGRIALRYTDIYATNATINTSDRNEKQDIAELSDAEQSVAVACKGLLRKFRWKDRVADKGDDARIHFGIIAQDLQAAFEVQGLDAGDYAMFISSTWWETQTEIAAVEAVEEVTDEEGNVTTEAVEAKDAYTRTDTYHTAEEAPEGATERTRLGVRYSELLAFIIAAI